MAEFFQHITAEYNTGPMFRVRGAWANDDQSAPITAPGVLKDNSRKNNDGVVTGTVTRVRFNRCVYGVCCDDTNYVTLPGFVFSELQGWRKDNTPTATWYFFEDANDVPEIEKQGEDYVLKSGCYAMLMESAEAVVLAAANDFNDADFDPVDFVT